MGGRLEGKKKKAKNRKETKSPTTTQRIRLERFVSCGGEKNTSLWPPLSKTTEKQRETIVCYINIKECMCL